MTHSKADLLKELTRLTEEYGGYDREFEAQAPAREILIDAELIKEARVYAREHFYCDDRAYKILTELANRLEARTKILIDVMASLAAAISTIERSPRKGGPPPKMFDQMLADYRASLERARAAFPEASHARRD